VLYFWIVVVSILFVFIALTVASEKKEVKMNCEACKFAEKGVCQRKPIPTANKDGRCPFFIKRRMK
jgi:uncharacterized MAPEG superfamily protein